MGSAGSLPHGIGTSYVFGYPRLYDRLLPYIGTLEIVPDTMLKRAGDKVIVDPDALAELREYASHVTLTLHGVGLSIGSARGWNEDYLRHLDTLFEALPIAWHSEHLAYSIVDGQFLGTMLPIRRNDAAFQMLCERVAAIRQRYAAPFLLENIANLMPEPEGTCTGPQFINALCRETGCGFLFDIYNLECDAHNLGIDIDAWMDRVDTFQVRELHVAKGIIYDDLCLDVHSKPTADETLVRTRAWLERSDHRVQTVIYEFLEEALPTLGEDGVVAEVIRLIASLGTAEPRTSCRRSQSTAPLPFSQAVKP